MDFSIEGKLASIDVPRKKGLQPLYEAVVNAFQAIEERVTKGRGRIEVTVQRENRLAGLEGMGRVSGFTIVDDGVGFTAANLASFFTAYSQNKLARGGKGIGRFTFLKVFEKTEIDSHFLHEGEMVSRLFALPETYHRPADGPQKSLAPKPRTSIELTGMREPWRTDCEAKLEAIAMGLVTHCIPYFMNPDCPVVELRDDDERVDVNAFFESHFQRPAQSQEFEVDGHPFKLTGFKLWNARAETKHRLLYAANYRAVISETLTNELPSIGDHHLPGDDGRKFVYLGFLEGPYLNEHTSAERLRFTFPDGESVDGNVLEGMPSLASIRSKAVDAVKEDLAPFLKQIADEAEVKVRKFVSRNPELRPMLRYMPKFIHEIAPNASETRINDVLQRQKFVEEKDIRREGTELLKSVTKTTGRPADYDQKLAAYFERSNEMGKSSLAKYVAHRRVILEFLEKSLEIDPETEAYPLEKVLHEIIYPMKSQSGDEVPYERQNLWIIDERLAFHAYLASDKQLRSSKALKSRSASAPDLMVLNGIFDEAVSFAPEDDQLTSLVVVEFKRPNRDDYGKGENPVQQANRMVREIRTGKRKRDTGRDITVVSDKIPAYVYIICDLTDSMRIVAEDAAMQKTVDQVGYYTYSGETKTYVEIIPYSKLLGDAKKRNKQLFDKLFSPTIG